MTRFVFLRHAAALNVTGRCIGHTNVMLSPEGEFALHELVESERQRATLSDTTIRQTTTIISSDLKRAEQSAQVIATALGIPISTDTRLREMSFGEWDGRSWNEIEEAEPQRFQEWMQQWTLVAPPSGETVRCLQLRAIDWLNVTLEQKTLLKRTLIVISHAGWIRCALCHLLNLPVMQMFDIPVDYAQATIVSVENGRAQLIDANVKRFL